MYSYTTARLVGLGVEKDCVEHLDKVIQSEEIFNELSRDPLITMGTFLTFLITNSRERFYDMQKDSMEYIEKTTQISLFASPQRPIIYDNEEFQSLEDVLPAKSSNMGQYHLLKNLVSSQSELVEKNIDKANNPQSKKLSKPKSEISVCNLSQPTLFMDECGQFSYQTTMTSTGKENNWFKTTQRPKTTANHTEITDNCFSRNRAIYSRGKETRRADSDITRANVLASSLSDSIPVVSHSIAKQKVSKKPSTADPKGSSLVDQVLVTKKNSKKSAGEVFKNCMAQVARNPSPNEEEKKDMQNALFAKVYAQLLASNNGTRKTLEKYQTDYSAYRQKEELRQAAQTCPSLAGGSLDSLDNEIPEKPIKYGGSFNNLDSTRYDSSRKSVGNSSNDEDIMHHFIQNPTDRLIKSTPKTNKKFFNENQASPPKKKCSSSSKKNSARDFLALPKLNIVENLTLGQPNLEIIKNYPKRVVVNSVESSKRLKRKSVSKNKQTSNKTTESRPSSTKARTSNIFAVTDCQPLLQKSLQFDPLKFQEITLRSQNTFELVFQAFEEASGDKSSFTVGKFATLHKQPKRANSSMAQSRKKVVVKG